MKAKMITVILFSLLTLCVSSQKLGVYTIVSKDVNSEIKAAPIVDFFTSKKLNSAFSLSSYLYVSQSWAEAMLYLDYSPKPWVTISLGGGIEQTQKLLRGTASLWLGKNNWSLINIYELGFGQDNYWYKSQLNYQLSKTIGVGYLAKRYFGLGPVIKVSVSKSLDFWAAPLRDFESKQYKIATGISINL
jgi:hypothetical protein